MIRFEAQTAIVNPSEARPAVGLRNSQLWKWLSAGCRQIQSEWGHDTNCFHQTLYLLFPLWSYTDRFGPRNINSKIKETNRRLRRLGNKYDTRSCGLCLCAYGVRLCNKSCSWCGCVCVSLCIFDMRSHSHVGVYAFVCVCVCVLSRLHLQLCCLQPCAAASLCVPLLQMSVARGPLMYMYMCHPLQQIRNLPQSVPLSFPVWGRGGRPFLLATKYSAELL